jgi:PHD/YefM family antitoxin component YafN of YafNO toxin-antitoxin module
MVSVTLNNAVGNLPKIIADTISNQEETIIVTDDGAVVMLSQHNWDGMLETLRLLKDKKSLKALLDGQARRKQGVNQGKSPEEIFYDL